MPKAPKTKKIDVITVKITCHIPVERDDRESVDEAYHNAERLWLAAESLGQTTWERRLNRVPAPKPLPQPTTEADDGLDVPDNLRRTADTEQTGGGLENSPAGPPAE